MEVKCNSIRSENHNLRELVGRAALRPPVVRPMKHARESGVVRSDSVPEEKELSQVGREPSIVTLREDTEVEDTTHSPQKPDSLILDS